jgi:hypothetical protein
LFIGWLLLGVTIGFLIATIINFQNQLLNELYHRLPGSVNLLPEGMFDESHIMAIKDISSLVPENETIIVSDNAPIFEYFSNHHAKAPRNINSEKSLFDYMIGKGYKYLIVYEGLSQEEALSDLFSSEGLKELNNDFNSIANFSTHYNELHLYKTCKPNNSGQIQNAKIAGHIMIGKGKNWNG